MLMKKMKNDTMTKMPTRAAIALSALLAAGAAQAQAQTPEPDEVGAITARVHGTFQDTTGGLGVLSGDMNVLRFEVRNGTIVAIGQIVGALADSAGNPMGRVNQSLELPVSNVASTCNQLRMDLAAADADVLQTPIHFDPQVAGFDSREGMVPKALGVLCTASELLRGKPSADSLTRALNDIATATATPAAR
jgi:hypothetical protein